MTYFTNGFGSYVVHGDTITCHADGFDLTATIYHDDDTTPPWEREDGHGPVSEWTDRSKDPGERVLCQDRSHRRYYDFQEACKIALHEGWSFVPADNSQTKTAKAYAARAVERDFTVLKAWCDDQWHYYGVAVTVAKNDVQLTGQYAHAVWGVEGNYPGSDNDYLREVANELAEEALQAAEAQLEKLCAKGR